MSRRAVIGRVSKGALVAGVAAWVTPEILIATPSAAGALSAPPGSTSGSGSGSGTPTAASDGVGSQTVAAGGASTGDPGASPSSSGTADPSTAAAGDGGGLPFTGFDALRDVEIGAGLLAGGWALKRWASRSPHPAPAGGGDGTGDQAPLV